MAVDWDNIIKTVGSVVDALAPVVELAVPELATALSLGQKIIQGVIAAEPVAISLYERFQSGTPPTADELQKYAADYEAAYQQTNKDILEALANTPA